MTKHQYSAHEIQLALQLVALLNDNNSPCILDDEDLALIYKARALRDGDTVVVKRRV